MDFVDEQHVVRFEVGEHGSEIAGTLKHGAGGLAQADTHLAGDDVRQRSFSEPRWPEQKDVIERVATALGGFDEDIQLLADLGLTDIVGQTLRPQGTLDGVLLARFRFG